MSLIPGRAVSQAMPELDSVHPLATPLRVEAQAITDMMQEIFDRLPEKSKQSVSINDRDMTFIREGAPLMGFAKLKDHLAHVVGLAILMRINTIANTFEKEKDFASARQKFIDILKSYSEASPLSEEERGKRRFDMTEDYLGRAFDDAEKDFSALAKDKTLAAEWGFTPELAGQLLDKTREVRAKLKQTREIMLEAKNSLGPAQIIT